MARTTFFVSFALFASTTLAREVTYHFKISNHEIAPDGVYRNATLVNERYPGPLITAQKGDTLKINVENKLTNPSMLLATSIHWHGLHEHRNADDDGPAFVTQCPIIPEASYTYTIPLGEQTGTYWYHGHLGTQYVDGLRGPIVICKYFRPNDSIALLNAPTYWQMFTIDPEDPHKNLYDIDNEETVLVLGDWYHRSSVAIEQSGNITLQQPDSATINGKGRFDPDKTPANPDTLHTFKVKRGMRYRLRVINDSAIASFRFSVQNHKIKVIAADGVPTQPYEADEFDILPAQRRDFVLEANQQPGTYWINAPLTNVANKTTQALLVYEDDARAFKAPEGPHRTWSVSEDVIKYWQHSHHGHGHGSMPGSSKRKIRSKRQSNATQIVLDETKLAPLNHKKPCNPGEAADMTLDLNFGLGQAGGTWAINNITYKSPATPTLLNILQDDRTTESDFSQSEHTVILPKHKCIEFNIKGNSGIPITHPFHLHGHTFSVVQYGNNVPNYVDPPQGDVVGSPDSGVRLRFKTDNAGPWFLHCHIDWHLVEGLAMVFAEAPEEIKQGSQSVAADSQWNNLCKEYDAWAKTAGPNQNPDL
ncbi:unnamed protein product [Rhizoctonia solani]|uniref:Laccase, multicopper oxidase, benzenediol:oxygen oxidorectuctase n=1 Tax=Rhizoctonia solani TaxID=456999 RepID=A0A8H3BY39_9AGAM|nr:unnamed protein product [Rhizoctonia solani]